MMIKNILFTLLIAVSSASVYATENLKDLNDNSEGAAAYTYNADSMGDLGDIPLAPLKKIFTYLTDAELVKVERVSKGFQCLADDALVIRELGGLNEFKAKMKIAVLLFKKHPCLYKTMDECMKVAPSIWTDENFANRFPNAFFFIKCNVGLGGTVTREIDGTVCVGSDNSAKMQLLEDKSLREKQRSIFGEVNVVALPLKEMLYFYKFRFPEKYPFLLDAEKYTKLQAMMIDGFSFANTMGVSVRCKTYPQEQKS